MDGDEGIEDIVLEHGGALYEGLSSNFGIIKDGVLHTAPQGTVLFGTIQRLIIEACERRNIPIIYIAPSIDETMQCDGAYISSIYHNDINRRYLERTNAIDKYK